MAVDGDQLVCQFLNYQLSGPEGDQGKSQVVFHPWLEGGEQEKKILESIPRDPHKSSLVGDF